MRAKASWAMPISEKPDFGMFFGRGAKCWVRKAPMSSWVALMNPVVGSLVKGGVVGLSKWV